MTNSSVSDCSAGQPITDEVPSWPGVEAGTGQPRRVRVQLGSASLGHLHGDRAHTSASRKQVWHELHEQGRIDYHPVFPGKPGYAARRIENRGRRGRRDRPDSAQLRSGGRAPWSAGALVSPVP